MFTGLHGNIKYIEVIAFILTLICLAVSIKRCAVLLEETETYAKSSDAALAMQIGSDMRLSINAVNRYQATGDLYEKPSGPDETVASFYIPMTPKARYTPVFFTQIILMANSQSQEALITTIRKSMIVVYFLSCIGLAARVSAAMQKKGIPLTKILFFNALAAISATSNYGLQDAVRITNYEIIIFSLLIVSFLFLESHPNISAVIIGFLGAAKFYPALMASVFLTRWDIKVIFTLTIAVFLFLLFGLACFGLNENLFYWTQVFPVILSEEIAPIMYNMSFGSGIFKFSQDLEFTKATFQAYRILFFVLTFLLIAKKYKNLNKIRMEVFALLMTLMLICLPNYWQTYLIILFPAFCIAAYRTVVRPNTVAIASLLICMASIATDNNSWAQFGAPEWLIGRSAPDETGKRIIEAFANQGMGVAQLLFAWHYPQTAFLYLLEQIKFIVPAILWLFTAREINSPAKLQNLH